MTVYAVIETYDNGETWEDYFTSSEILALYSTKEKAINAIKEKKFPTPKTSEASRFKYFKRWNVVEELNKDDIHFYPSKDRKTEIIRVVSVTLHEEYDRGDGKEEWIDSTEYYQYTIKEMEVM